MKLEPVAWMDDFGNAFPLAANKGAGSWRDEHKRNWKPLYAIPEGYVVVPVEPTEAQWGELARDIMFVLRQERPTPRKLLYHLEHLHETLPEWLRNEAEMQNLDHVISKGTCCVLIYKAMLAAKEQS